MKPLLSATVEDVTKLKYPLLASPKLDGIRALVIDGVLVSRNKKPIANAYVQATFGKPEFNGLDGELICGDPCHLEAFRRTTSAVMSHDGSPPDVHFHVFDNFMSTKPFSERIMQVTRLARGKVRPVPHTTVHNVDELQAYEEECLEQGYEGVMLRDPHGHYKHGRSTLNERILMKLKRFADDEAEVIAVEEQMKNTNELTRDALGRAERSNHKAGMVGKGTLGSLRVRGLTGPYKGVEYSVGSGMDDALRAEFWAKPPIGATIKVKYFPTGSKDAPRFPVYLGVRYD